MEQTNPPALVIAPCHEHVGDESFAYIMANLAALALERRKG
ncbi:MAG TPA: hypothetical protein VM869_16440 [Enhygromyxa sp.]|nr:hypothetical protein [Enhygromyxa sp.]